MSLKLKIKVGNITNLSDARYSAGMGVDWLGFRMDNIDPQTFREITGWVTGPRFVIEIHQPSDLNKAVDYTPDYLEIPGLLKKTEALVQQRVAEHPLLACPRR